MQKVRGRHATCARPTRPTGSGRLTYDERGRGCGSWWRARDACALLRRTRPSGCTPRTGYAWSGWRCCSWTTCRPRRTWSRTPSPPSWYDGPGSTTGDKALTYLRTSVVNGARSKLRRRRTARAYVPPHEVPRDATSEGALLAEEHREVLAALRELAPRQREVLVLRYWSGLSEAEIAEALDISRGAVKSTASRALDALEKTMEVSR